MLLFLISFMAFAETDSRMEIPEVKKCVEFVKSQMPSYEIVGPKEAELISSCRNVEQSCLETVVQSISSVDRVKADKFFPLVRLCKGQDTDLCVTKVLAGVPSYSKDNSEELSALMSKCQ